MTDKERKEAIEKAEELLAGLLAPPWCVGTTEVVDHKNYAICNISLTLDKEASFIAHAPTAIKALLEELAQEKIASETAGENAIRYSNMSLKYEAEIKRLRKQAEEDIELLKSVEWRGKGNISSYLLDEFTPCADYEIQCPLCEGEDCHSPDCELAARLKEGVEE